MRNTQIIHEYRNAFSLYYTAPQSYTDTVTRINALT